MLVVTILIELSLSLPQWFQLEHVYVLELLDLILVFFQNALHRRLSVILRCHFLPKVAALRRDHFALVSRALAPLDFLHLCLAALLPVEWRSFLLGLPVEQHLFGLFDEVALVLVAQISGAKLLLLHSALLCADRGAPRQSRERGCLGRFESCLTRLVVHVARVEALRQPHWFYLDVRVLVHEILVRFRIEDGVEASWQALQGLKPGLGATATSSLTALLGLAALNLAAIRVHLIEGG